MPKSDGRCSVCSRISVGVELSSGVVMEGRYRPFSKGFVVSMEVIRGLRTCWLLGVCYYAGGRNAYLLGFRYLE